MCVCTIKARGRGERFLILTSKVDPHTERIKSDRPREKGSEVKIFKIFLVDGLIAVYSLFY